MDYDVIIVGAGSMGMAAGYYLAKKGKRILLLDSYDPPHTEGSHHGETRIIRHAYGEGESYVAMALRAQALWNELQKLSDEELFINTGVINIAQPDSRFIQNVIKSAEKYSLNVEQLSAEEINQRWEGFQVPEGYIGCYELDSGVLMSENCIRAFKKEAIKHGAVLKAHAAVTSISIFDEHVQVATAGESFTADSLILTPGAAARKLLPLIGLELPLQELRNTFSWFETDESIYPANRFPAFTFELPTEMYYGFPSINGAGVKIGRHDGGRPRDMRKPPEEFGAHPQDQQDVSRFANRYMSKVGQHVSGQPCTYTNTPDEDFIIDKHPDYDHVILACGFSGHGFKFSSAVGEILSELATENRQSALDISPFTINRF
ncbi:N-methyl-L-tryptophan oxidase [Planococcus shenhongbingii]|uniref:N-methyl-L-tryptophan oxidase n=1 Tax=Planococcus shenhongbingii TaxID=3058398 RepID=A0ABT8NHK8_9BACL|nr:N-methyl-L-tryptophan oxidase [Planococcus sp. N017]MDN7247378.1 N-methyl-L-tryptophan oxidase [Planococcus sp. N017]